MCLGPRLHKIGQSRLLFRSHENGCGHIGQGGGRPGGSQRRGVDTRAIAGFRNGRISGVAPTRVMTGKLSRQRCGRRRCFWTSPQAGRGGGGWIRTNVGVRQRIYSPPPLATRAPLQTGQEAAAILRAAACQRYPARDKPANRARHRPGWLMRQRRPRPHRNAPWRVAPAPGIAPL